MSREPLFAQLEDLNYATGAVVDHMQRAGLMLIPVKVFAIVFHMSM